MRAVLVLLAWPLAACGGPTTVSAPMIATSAGHALPATALPAIGEERSARQPSPSALPPLPAVAVAVPTPASALALATRVESFYASALPFECDLDVETTLRSHPARHTWRAHVVFARPGRFHVALPAGVVMAVDSQTETMFDPATLQVRQRPVARDHCPIALSYAAGAGALAGHLSLQAHAGAAMNAQGLDILVGRPVTPSPSFTVLVFYVEPTGLVRRAVFVLPTGDRQRYDTVACNMHVQPPAALFAVGAGLPTTNVPPAAPSVLTDPLP